MRSAISNAFAKTSHLLAVSSLVGLCSKGRCGEIYSSRRLPYRFRTFTNPFKENRNFVLPCHFTLQKGEVFRLPSACREIQVLSGVAWITVAGEDIILIRGKTATLALNKDEALVSAINDAPLILEAL